MLLGVAEDVTDGGEGTPVATGWLEVSLGGVPVVVGCGGGTLALGAGGLAPSAGVVLALVRPEAGAEAPSNVAGMALERKGAAVLRGVVKMEGAAGVLAGGVGPAVVWVVGSVVVSVGRGLVFGVEAEAGSVLGAGGGERGTHVDAVGLLVATGVEVVDAGA